MLGLSVGAVLVLAGLTGSLLVFYIELDEIITPELRLPTAGPARRYEVIYQALLAAHPQRGPGWRIERPRDSDVPISARYYRPRETSHLAFAPLMVVIDPHTAAIITSRFWGQYLMTWLYDLHYSLLLDKPGKIAMGIVGIAMAISLVSGVYLWWPSWGRVRGALTLKRHAGSQRLTYDLHKLSGIYGLIVLLGIAVTGVFLELPDYLNPLLDRVSPLYQPPDPLSHMPAGRERLPVDAAIQTAGQRFPDAQWRWVWTPKGPDGSYRVDLRQPGEPWGRFPKTSVWIDQYDGSLLAARDARNDGAADIFLAWLHPLHSGEALGLPGRVIILVSGLLPTMLYVTGLLRWCQKRRARKVTARKRDARSVSAA